MNVLRLSHKNWTAKISERKAARSETKEISKQNQPSIRDRTRIEFTLLLIDELTRDLTIKIKN
jgi:hypothetical protein